MKKEDLKNLLIVLEIAIIFVLIAFLIAKPVVKGWEKSQNVSHSYSKSNVWGKNKPKIGTKNDIPEDIKKRLDRPNPSIPDTRRLDRPSHSEHAARRVAVPTNPNCPIYLNGYCFSKPKKVKAINYDECSHYKNKYGASENICNSSNGNYKMSAVVQCKGLYNLPNIDDWKSLTSQLYNIDISEIRCTDSDFCITPKEVTANKKISEKMNLPFHPELHYYEFFQIWINTNKHNEIAMGQFNTNKAIYSHRYPDSNIPYAMCKIK